MNAKTIEAEIAAAGNPEKAAGAMRYFKVAEGQYGEGDIFVGVTSPELAQFIRKYRQLPLDETVKLLKSRYHEVRSCGFQILVEQYRRGDDAVQEEIYRLYLGNRQCANNWDLVDTSAPGIVGEHLLTRERSILYVLAESSLLWDQRIAMISTLTLIRNREFGDTLKLARLLMDNRHDLIHKATGWMLREIGKRDREVLTEFLTEHKSGLPRTALRYAIEHYPEPERKEFLKA